MSISHAPSAAPADTSHARRPRPRRRHRVRPLGAPRHPRRAGPGRRGPQPAQLRHEPVRRRHLDRLRSRRRPRRAIRLPRPRRVGTRARCPVQSGQAPPGPVRPGHHLRRRLLRPDPGPHPRVRLRAGHHRLVRRRAAQRRGRREPGPEARRAAPHDGPERRLRAARQGLHPAPSGRAGAPARDVRGTCLSGRHPAPARPRCHRSPAAAGAPLRLRTVPDRPWTRELLGLQQPRLLRPARCVLLGGHHGRAGPRVQGDGLGPARGRHRGHPRRRLQPHRRGRPRGSDAVLPRHRPRRLLPADRRSPKRLRRHRLRQLRRQLRAGHASADHRLAALLGERDGCRRVPVRPGDDVAPGRSAPCRPGPPVQGGAAR